MRLRLVLVALLLAGASAQAQQATRQPAPTVLASGGDGSGDTGRGCLTFAKPLAAGPVAHAEDLLALAPPARPSVSISGNEICLGGLGFGTHYTVTIAPGLAFADGAATQTPISARLDIPDRDPLVAVAGRGWILPREGATGVTIQTVNVPLVRIRVLRVSERSLAAATPAGGPAMYGLRPDPARQSFRLGELQELTKNAATVIWSGTMRTIPGRNRSVETAFPLAGIVDPAKPGAYIVLAENAAAPPVKLTRSDDEPYDWHSYETPVAGHWVLTTDLGLSSLQGLDGLHATVRSLASAAPLPGVRLQLLSLAQDVLCEAVTDANGAASFAPGLLRGKRGAAAAVLLASGPDGDIAVQDLTAPAFDLSDRGAGGRLVPGPIEAYLYTDRGIYRPGERVQVMALLRAQGLTAVDGTGLTLLLRRPDGVEASRVTLPPQPDAGFHWALDLSKTAAQGNWTIEALVDPTLPPVGRAAIAVQDFVPQQLKVTLTGPVKPVAAGAPLTASLDGRFLYGAPAAGLHAEGEIRLERDEHPVADAPGYSFGLVDETVQDPVQPLTLPDADASGHVAIGAALKLPDDFASPLRAVLDAGLTEPGGRAVRETVSVPVQTHALLIGLRTLFSGAVEEGSSAAFDIRAFSAAGAPVAKAGLTWRLIAENRAWDWWRGENDDGPWTFHYHVIDSEVARGALDVAADRPAAWSRTLGWGDYRMVVTDPASGAASSVRFSVGWGEQSAAADIPDRLDVSTDQPMLEAGQTARIHLKAPFAGQAQVVIESAGRVLSSRTVDLPEAGVTLDVTASPGWGAGVHVLATAYRPLTAHARPHTPVRAVGLAWIAADPAPHTLAVTIGGPRQVTPRQTVTVPIHVAGAHGLAFVTLAAVDEGILQLTQFASPDPVAALLGRTRFGLDMRDDYGRLLEGQAEAGSLQEGGDAGAALGGAGLPVTTTRVVALYHAPVALDASGDATVALDVPDFAGELRLMAVAYDHDAAGHAEAALTVRDPVVADVALPRFLAPADRAGIALSLNDTDAAPGSYHLALVASGAVAVSGPSALDATLVRGQRWTGQTGLTAAAASGIGHLAAVLTGPAGLRIEHDFDIAVRSPHPDLVLSRTGVQQPGETYQPDVAALLAPFLPGSVHLTVGYSALGAIDVPALLQSLYTYPYGCTEQLSASAMPLLYFSDARLLGRPAGDPAIHSRVQAAIDTIADRQDATGRFGLWRVGDGEASDWLNVFALDFLLRAREAGFSVPDRIIAASAAWIEGELQSDSTDTDGAYAQPAAPTRAYADYVLARTGRVDPGRLRLLSRDLVIGITPQDGPMLTGWRNVNGPALPLSLAQLAGAQSLMGNTEDSAQTFRLALAELNVSDAPDWWYGAFYWSSLRDTAGILTVAAETGHADVAAELLDRIGRDNLDPERLNTQEKAWLLAAAHALLKNNSGRNLAIGGAPAAEVALPFAYAPSAGTIAQGVTIRNADAKPVFRTVTLRGSPATAPPALSAGYTLRRETFTLSGAPLDDAKLRQTDRFIVVLSGAEDNDSLRRTVVNDPLPAGIEIEAPVLREESYPFLGQLTRPRAVEARDDRFIAAFDLGGGGESEVNDDVKNRLGDGEFRLAYLARAVTPGHFIRPETVVQDMYRPAVMARTAAGTMDVAPR